MKPAYLYHAVLIGWFILSAGLAGVDAQGLMQAETGSTDLFDKFQDEQFIDKSDQEIMQEEFKKKRASYESLMSRESPIFFRADAQEIDEAARIFVLSGNVEIWKDMFKLKAEWVRIFQWSGLVEARGNVVIEFADDVLTGDEANYNFDTGTGWLSNARAAVNPQLYLEADRLEKWMDLESNGEGQYALYGGMITACSSTSPAWRFEPRYAVIRLENYVHMNSVSAWIKKIPIFWTPYFFYPTKTGRATGLLTPSIKWSSSRGLIVNEEFFWCISDTMDATLGLTYHSIIGLMEEIEIRNAFDRYSKGELHFEHIREDESPSETRNPEERWKLTYEQNAVFPGDIRGTANINYQSDESFDDDYADLSLGRTQYLDSRVSFSRYWGASSLTLDASYEKDFSPVFDTRLEHLPRLEYFTGWKTLVGDLRWQMRVQGERLFKGTNEIAVRDDQTVPERLEEEALRGYFYGEIWYEFNEIPWLGITPWILVDERIWDKKKTEDLGLTDGTWATYDTPPETPDNQWKASLTDMGDGLHRHIFRTGIDFNGPKFYRIFDMLGYQQLSRMKHVVEPKISLDYTPELLGQEEILYFDRDDFMEPGTRLTYSMTTRLLMKLVPEKQKKTRKTAAEDADGTGPLDLSSGAGYTHTKTDSSKDLNSTDADAGDDDGTDTTERADRGDVAADDSAEEGDDAQEKGVSTRDGIIRDFGSLTISQTYDFYKNDQWERREVKPGEDERIYYPYSNVKLDLMINPYASVYLSGRVEYDPWYDEISSGYIYGFFRQKDWKFGIRWDYSRYFLDDFFDLHALALEGGMHLSDRWSFNSWVKYDFAQDFFPYAVLDLTYMSQCWGVTLHTYYKNNREFDILAREYDDRSEVKFGLSFHLKNVDTIDTDTFGRFWWGDER
ncbi:LPS-assembly protein LptD [bacterium]|nr:LPS-assembly protein LptD [candidate division CSSED10-310 bacterium]